MILMKPKEEHYHASGPQRPRPLMSISIRILGVLVQIVHKRLIKVLKGVSLSIRWRNVYPITSSHTSSTVVKVLA